MSSRPGLLAIEDGAGGVIGYASVLIAPGADVENGRAILPGVSAGAFDATSYKGASAPSATEFNYLAGVTSAIQTQLNTKAPLASPALTGTPTAPTAVAATNTTQLATTAFVHTAVANLVDTAPGTLDTLNELAAALGDDPNFATTVTNAIAGKQPLDATLTALAGLTVGANKLIYATGADAFTTTDLSAFGRSLIDDADASAARATIGLGNVLNVAQEPAIAAGTTAQYWRGDKSWQTLNTAAVPESGNLYYTQARFDTAFAAKSTTNLAEGSNLYYTDERVDDRVSALILGTANQITPTYNDGAGTLTLALPQDIHTGATPTFAGLLSSGTTFNLVNATATTVNIAGGASTVNIGNAAGTLSLVNATVSLTGTLLTPATNFNTDAGQLSKKFKSIHAAELWVETLVAQDTLATIGGRVLVGPTTSLIADLAPAGTTLDVKHNNLSAAAAGDVIYLESSGKVEFMRVLTGPASISGGYRYSVTRDLDGTGANQWYAGDAVFNTAQTGAGFIDLYSVQSVKSGAAGAPATQQAGPTIVGNVRNSSTYNDWSEHWAIGNLKGVYGYGSTMFGVAFGEYLAGKTHITIDSTNGYRIFNGTSTVIGQWDASGVITVGQVTASQSNILISSGAVQLRNNTTVRSAINSDGSAHFGTNIAISAAGVLTVGGWTVASTRISSTNVFLDQAGQYLSMGATPPTSYGANVGVFMEGANSGRLSLYKDANNYLQWDSTKLLVKAANFTLDSSGNLTASSATVSGAITATSGSFTGTVQISSASGALAVGTTPPTSASAGTGIWLDRTGMYGLASSVVQTKFDAATGAFTAAAGDLVLDSAGINLFAQSGGGYKASGSNAVKFIGDAAYTVARLDGASASVSGIPRNTSARLLSLSPSTLGQALTSIGATNDASGETVQIEAQQYGSGHASFPGAGYLVVTGADVTALSGKLLVGSSNPTTITATYALDVVGTAIFSGAVTLSGGVSGNVAFDTSTLYVDATNNRVGVVTASPSYPLHVVGQAFSSVGFSVGGAIPSGYQFYAETATASVSAGFKVRSSYASMADTFLANFGNWGSLLSHNRDPQSGSFVNAAASPNQVNACDIVVGRTNSAGATLACIFQVNNYPGGTETPRLMIDFSGNLGVNTNNQFGSGAGVIGIKNATTNPTSNPTGGGVLYADAGAGKWRGSSGTTTTFGPADPHCPKCGGDFVLEWENETYGRHLQVCMWCFTEGLTVMKRISVDKKAKK